jgi:hypothetical protein
MVDNKQELTMQTFPANAVRVMTKARKHLGVEYPATASEYAVVIEKDKSIAIFRDNKGTVEVCAKFNIGDKAEYDSYNLRYLGEIDKISNNTVTIVKKRGVSNKVHRLSMHEFCYRNYDFDMEKVAKENHEASMNI